MKKIIYIFCIALASCAAPKGSVDNFEMKDGQICGSGKIMITTPTKEQADSAVAATTKNLVKITHLSDSANVHTYGWELCSPKIQTK